uniref:C2H2-type domain-containing protein n=1 Tax=Steinernema glaseri TaxID=37863 RepID=A0A1I8AGI2_9BILA
MLALKQRHKELLAERDEEIRQLHNENHRFREKCYELELRVKKLTKESRSMKFKLDQIQKLPEWPELHIKIIKKEMEEDSAAYIKNPQVPELILYATKTEPVDDCNSTMGTSTSTGPTSSSSASTAQSTAVKNVPNVKPNKKKTVTAKSQLRSQRMTPSRKAASITRGSLAREAKKTKETETMPCRKSERLLKKALSPPKEQLPRRTRTIRRSSVPTAEPISNDNPRDVRALSLVTSPGKSKLKKCKTTICGTTVFFRYHVAEHEKIGIKCTVTGCKAHLDPYKNVHGQSVKDISLEQRTLYKAEITKFKTATSRLMQKYFPSIHQKAQPAKDVVTCKKCSAALKKWAYHSHICSHLNIHVKCPFTSCTELVHQNYLIKHMKKIHFKTVPELTKAQFKSYEKEKERVWDIVLKVKPEYF